MVNQFGIKIDGILAEETTTPLLFAYRPPNTDFELHPEEVCLQLHISTVDGMLQREFLHPGRIDGALAQIAHYLSMRQPHLYVQNIIGVTHDRMAKIAVDRFGFTPIDGILPEQFEERVIDILHDHYKSGPHMVAMEGQEFIDKFKTGDPLPKVVKKALANNADDESNGL